jgi:hypothetical protein
VSTKSGNSVYWYLLYCVCRAVRNSGYMHASCVFALQVANDARPMWVGAFHDYHEVEHFLVQWHHHYGTYIPLDEVPNAEGIPPPLTTSTKTHDGSKALMSVSVSGPDGHGTTTLTALLGACLQALGHETHFGDLAAEAGNLADEFVKSPEKVSALYPKWVVCLTDLSVNPFEDDLNEMYKKTYPKVTIIPQELNKHDFEKKMGPLITAPKPTGTFSIPVPKGFTDLILDSAPTPYPKIPAPKFHPPAPKQFPPSAKKFKKKP